MVPYDFILLKPKTVFSRTLSRQAAVVKTNLFSGGWGLRRNGV